MAHELVKLSLPLDSRGKPGKLRTANGARPGIDENKGGRSLRIRGCEQRAERTALAEANKNCTLRVRGVHHRTDVVHPYLERRRPDEAV